ncbi:MAG: hypothetical protein ACTS46_00130 [Candidatus Hodgkinia cicadicola]
MSSFDRLLLKMLKCSLAFTLISFVPFEAYYLFRTFINLRKDYHLT